MKTPRITALSLAAFLSAVSTGSSQDASAAGAKQLVNVATATFGAKGEGVGKNLVEGSQGTLASGGAAQPAFTVINLAGEVEMNRVALEVGNQKGKLRVVALKDDGTPDLSSGRVITEFTLDGSKTTVSADVSDVKVKTVAIVWVPDTPGTQLNLSSVGLFTSKPETITSLPEVKAALQAAPAAPAAAPAAAAPAAAPAAPAPAAASGSGTAATSSASSSSAATAGTATQAPAPTTASAPAAAASSTASSSSAAGAGTASRTTTPTTTPVVAQTTTSTAIPPQTRIIQPESSETSRR